MEVFSEATAGAQLEPLIPQLAPGRRGDLGGGEERGGEGRGGKKVKEGE
jgi:hypothetical protein